MFWSEVLDLSVIFDNFVFLDRFFVFLAYTNSFKDARPLKGNLEDIAKKVSGKLNTIANGKFNTNKYYYTKDRGLEGAYKVLSTSILVTDKIS